MRLSLGGRYIRVPDKIIEYRGSAINWCPIGRDASDKMRKRFVGLDYAFDLRLNFLNQMKTRPLIIAKLEEYFRDESIIVRSSRLIDELFTFIYHNNRAEAMVGYNDDLVMSFAIGLWVRDTALRLRTEGIELTKKTLSRMQDIDGLYTPDDQPNDSWSWEVNKKQ